MNESQIEGMHIECLPITPEQERELTESLSPKTVTEVIDSYRGKIYLTDSDELANRIRERNAMLDVIHAAVDSEECSHDCDSCTRGLSSDVATLERLARYHRVRILPDGVGRAQKAEIINLDGGQA